jgi:hypothetical protein
MSTPPEEPTSLTANMELAIGTQKLKLKLIVPADEVPPDSLVPALQELTNAIMGGVEKNAGKSGLKVSCKKGCGACCRQHVPISRSEARLLAEMVENLPEPKRTQMKVRFRDAVRQLRESGVYA